MPKTVHDYLRARLLEQAGIFAPAEPAPSLAVIARMQSCPRFEEYRKNRMIMGYFRYGSLQSQIGRAKYDNVGSIEKRLSIYKSDHNREHLVDIAHPMTAFMRRKKMKKIVQRDLTSIGCRACVRTQ